MKRKTRLEKFTSISLGLIELNLQDKKIRFNIKKNSIINKRHIKKLSNLNLFIKTPQNKSTIYIYFNLFSYYDNKKSYAVLAQLLFYIFLKPFPLTSETSIIVTKAFASI